MRNVNHKDIDPMRMVYGGFEPLVVLEKQDA